MGSGRWIPRGRTIFCNRRMAEILGATYESMAERGRPRGVSRPFYGHNGPRRGCREGAIAGAGAAGDGEQALTHCATQPPDLLVSDVVMPKVSGTELAARVGAVHPQVRVLFISGYSNEALSWPAGVHQNAGFLQKPFTIAALISKVREMLGHAVGT